MRNTVCLYYDHIYDEPRWEQEQHTKNTHLIIWGNKLQVSDYVYMRTNNAIISNYQSKDLIVLWCLHVKSKALHSRLHAISIFLLFAKNCG